MAGSYTPTQTGSGKSTGGKKPAAFKPGGTTALGSFAKVPGKAGPYTPGNGPPAPAAKGGKGAASPATDWLAPMTPAQIAAQATKTIGLAYAPAGQALNQQTKQAQGLSDKRTADNRYYLTWLNTQMQGLQAHADAANAALNPMVQQLHDQQEGLYAAQPGQLVAGAEARPGNVSNDANSHAFGADLNANQELNRGLLNAASQQALSAESVGNSQLGATAANNVNVISAAQSKQMADLQTALTGIANERAKLVTGKTADIAKEIARLQGVEIQKAQNQQSYAAAAAALNIKGLDTASIIAARAAGTATAAKNANTSLLNAKTALSRAQQSAMIQDKTYLLNVSKYNAATAKDLYERTHGLGPYKVTGHNPLTAASQNALYTKIDVLTGELNYLQQHGQSLSQAVQTLANGGTLAGTTVGQHTDSHGNLVGGHPKTFTAVGANDPLLAAAQALANGGSGLTPALVAKLQAQGLAHPRKHYGALNTSSGKHSPASQIPGIGSIPGL